MKSTSEDCKLPVYKMPWINELLKVNFTIDKDILSFLGHEHIVVGCFRNKMRKQCLFRRTATYKCVVSFKWDELQMDTCRSINGYTYNSEGICMTRHNKTIDQGFDLEGKELRRL